MGTGAGGARGGRPGLSRRRRAGSICVAGLDGEWLRNVLAQCGHFIRRPTGTGVGTRNGALHDGQWIWVADMKVMAIRNAGGGCGSGWRGRLPARGTPPSWSMTGRASLTLSPELLPVQEKDLPRRTHFCWRVYPGHLGKLFG